MIKRYQDWEQRLAAFIEENRRRPFEWGAHDCALFACNAVETISGVDLAAGFRGGYSTKEGARLAMMRYMVGSEGSELGEKTDDLLEAVCRHVAAEHGIQETPVRRAHRGDLALFETVRGPSLGVIALDGASIIGPGEKGYVKVRLAAALRVWRIG